MADYWQDEQVVALIDIWSDETIQLELEDARKTRKTATVYRKIQEKLEVSIK